MRAQKQILRILNEKQITFILIGGYAMRIYNSPRVTHDIDLAIKTIDTDSIIEILYHNNFYLVYQANDHEVLIQPTANQALQWATLTKSGSLSFIELKRSPEKNSVRYEEVDANTQIDFLFELSIPIMRLKQRAKKILYEGIRIDVASVPDLLTLKKDRKDKTAADYADIEFLEQLMADQKNN